MTAHAPETQPGAYVAPADPEPGAISGPPAPGSAGVVIRFDAAAAREAGVPAVAWVPAATARRVAFASATTTLGQAGGISLGLALVEGRLLTLVGFGPIGPRAPVVLCARPEADVFALAVATIVASGRFDDADDGGIVVGDERVAELDLGAITVRLEAAFWIADGADSRASSIPRSRKP